ncbi:MAG: hypothetical protein IJ684_04220 [Bacteroidales bacterium]|nr:hypothetical protein [Bacteroidales bacterium]
MSHRKVQCPSAEDLVQAASCRGMPDGARRRKNAVGVGSRSDAGWLRGRPA